MSGCSDADDNAMKRSAADWTFPQDPAGNEEDAPDAGSDAEPAAKKKRAEEH